MDRSNLVRCERHGTFYNPEKFDACAICRSAQESQEEPGLWFSPLKIATVLAVVLAMFFGIGRMTRAVGDHGGDVADAAVSDSRLDPERFRSSLESLEALVFADRTRSFSHGAAIMQVTFDLSKDIRATAADAGALVQARTHQYALEVMAFGQRQASMDDVGYAAFDLSQAQKDWSEVRGAVFRDASWFHAGVTQSGTSTAAVASAGMNPAVLRMLRDMATGLESTARFGRQQATGIPEYNGDPRSAEMRRVQSSWESFRHSMTTRLSSALVGLPEGPVLLSTDARRAHEHLTQAVRYLTSLVNNSGIPARSTRERAFDNADQSIREARRLLARV